jgi:hypothetical protein
MGVLLPAKRDTSPVSETLFLNKNGAMDIVQKVINYTPLRCEITVFNAL